MLKVGTINIKIATCYGVRRETRMKHTKKQQAKRRGREKFRSGQYQKLRSTEKCWQFPIAAAANVQAWLTF